MSYRKVTLGECMRAAPLGQGGPSHTVFPVFDGNPPRAEPDTFLLSWAVAYGLKLRPSLLPQMGESDPALPPPPFVYTGKDSPLPSGMASDDEVLG